MSSTNTSTVTSGTFAEACVGRHRLVRERIRVGPSDVLLLVCRDCGRLFY